MSQSSAWRRDWPLMLILLILAIVTYTFPLSSQSSTHSRSMRSSSQEFWLPTLPLASGKLPARLAGDG